MPGKCYGCWSSFGAFNKELECENCGFSFCKKCLTKKADIPKTGREKQPVCNKCYAVLSGACPPSYSSVVVEPPDILSKRLAESECLKEKRKKKLLELKEKNEVKKKDHELMERLENLKDLNAGSKHVTSKPIPSEEEIEKRLRSIRDSHVDSALTSDARAPKVFGGNEVDSLLEEISNEVFLENKTSTIPGEYEKPNNSSAEGLLEEVTNQIKLENQARHKQDEEDAKLMNRLENLKNETLETLSVRPGHNKILGSEGNNHDDPSKSALSELRQKWKMEEEDEVSDLMYCCMCDKNAEVQCQQCDGDLFCHQCSKAYHDRIYEEKHIPLPWKGTAKNEEMHT